MVKLLHITCDWLFKDYTCSLADNAAGSGRQMWQSVLPGKRVGQRHGLVRLDLQG